VASRESGQFTTIDFPAAANQGVQDNPPATSPENVDSAGKLRGFLLSGGTFKTIDSWRRQTMVYGINSEVTTGCISRRVPPSITAGP
jgi:hypothetical protein